MLVGSLVSVPKPTCFEPMRPSESLAMVASRETSIFAEVTFTPENCFRLYAPVDWRMA